VLIARRNETGAIEELLDGTGPRGLLLEGEAGIGKTSMWSTGVDAARARGMAVLVARPAGTEVRLSFSGLADLIGHLPASAFADLPPPQQRALDAALLRVDGSGDATEARAVGQGLIGVLRTVAAGAPAVLAIDDLQWLDPPSARAVVFALRRLVDEPVALLATVRMDDGGPPPFGVERALPDGALQRLRVGPMDAPAVGRLLRARLDVNLSRPALARLHERCGGNPLFALEIGRLLDPGRIEAADVLPLPRSLRDLVHERLAWLPPRTRRTLLAAAALSHPRLDLLGPTAESDLRPAVDAGIVRMDGDTVRFAHPLLAFVPYEEAPAAQRRRLHARLAGVVPDGEEHARHLALAAAGPDEDVARELDRAARLALARGAPDAAAELAALAQRLTPGSSVERLLAEAEYTFESGDSTHARVLMGDAVDRLDPGPLRAHALARLAWFRGGWGDDPHGAIELLDGAVKQAANDLAVQAEVFECLTWQCHLVGRHDDAARYARLGASAASELGDPRWIALLGVAVALAEGKAGRSRAARIAVADIENAESVDARVINDPGWVQAIFLASDGEIGGALTSMRQLHERALQLGDESSLPNLLEHEALLEFRAGDWRRADQMLEAALEIAVRTDQQIQRLALRSWRAFLDVHLGRVEPARLAAAETIAATEARRLPVYSDAARWALMRLALSEDDPATALAEFGRMHNPHRGIGEHSFFRHYGDAAQALADTGDAAAAASTVRRWRAHAAALDHAAAGPGGDRCLGLAALAAGDAARGLALLEQAVARGRLLDEPFELARSLLALGTARRRSRQKRPAAESLGEALELFQQLPAPLWEEQARRELARIGGRRVAAGELTETERRVAELVATGRSNAEVARALVLSPKTVEWNLSKIYRKLGVRARAELAARLAGQT
jgi:DNA-binding CsgD family transcriptional regulator